MIRSLIRVLAAGTFGITVTVVADTHLASAEDFAAADALILHLMSTDAVPGAALALIKDGKIVLEKGYGLRDLETKAPVTKATLFNVGSISKSFTAMGIVQLVDRQQADLDASITKYVPDFQLSDPHAVQALTLRRLLSHTTGLPADERWPPQVPSTRDGIVAEFANIPINAAPGIKFQYCSRCIVLAAYILERITGQSWEAFTRAQIFDPLGMITASFGPHGLEQAVDHARPYRHEAASGQVTVPWSRLQYLEPLAPGGGIDASVEEMARYALFQLGDGTIEGHRLLSREMMAALHGPEIAVGDDWSLSARRDDLHYALGWFTAENHGAHLVFHNGANPGFRAAIFLAPSSKAGVVVLTNGEADHFNEVTTRILLERLLRE